jgi:hypothetical protein
VSDDRQGGRFGHAVHDGARKGTGHANDGSDFACLEFASLDFDRAAGDFAAHFLFEHTAGGKEEWLGKLSAHTRSSTANQRP